MVSQEKVAWEAASKSSPLRWLGANRTPTDLSSSMKSSTAAWER